MRVKKAGFIFFASFIGFFFLIKSAMTYPNSEEKLPQLFESVPKQLYQLLGPVGATKKKVLEARTQLQREAKKMDADAVVGVSCQEGGFRRDGLTWSHHEAYCRGIAVKYLDPKEETGTPQ